MIFETSDGAQLAYERSGEGPVLVLVHGSATDSRCFEPVLPHFGGYTTVAYDRRGHGRSQDGTSPYSLAREVADLLELIAHVAGAEPVYALGWSYGALITLHAMSSPGFRAAVLYEPPMADEGIVGHIPDVLALIDAGRHDDAAALFVSRTFLLRDSVISAMRRGPMWQVSVDLMPRMHREFPVVAAATDVTSPRSSAVPTRVLVASKDGNPGFDRVAEAIERALPDCEVATVPGLPHFAMATEPEAFARAAREHLERH